MGKFPDYIFFLRLWLNVYRQISTKMLIRQSLITQVTPHLSRTVSSETMSISRIKDKTKKMNTLYYLIFLKLRKNRYCCSFHIAPKMSSQLNDSWQNSINFPIKNFGWVLSGSLRKLKVSCLCKRRTVTQRAKFIKELVYSRRHNLVKQFGMLSFDGMSIKTYARDLKLQSV